MSAPERHLRVVRGAGDAAEWVRRDFVAGSPEWWLLERLRRAPDCPMPEVAAETAALIFFEELRETRGINPFVAEALGI
jgi:hypothetical protein